MRYVPFVLIFVLFALLSLSYSQTPIDKAGRILIDQPAKIHVVDGAKQYYKMTIVHDFEQLATWVSNSHFDDIFNSNEFYLPEDTYTLLFFDFPSRSIVTMVAMENFRLANDTTITISKNMAEHSTEYSFVRENGDTLHQHGFGKYIINTYTALRLLVRCYHMDTTSVIWQYNFLPTMFDVDWSVKGKPHYNNDRNLYLLNGKAEFSCNDTLIRNDPQNYAYGHLHYFFPDSIENYRPLQFGIFNPGFHWYQNDPPHNATPHDVKVFQDTTGGEATYGPRFHTTVNLMWIIGTAIFTPEIRILEDKIVSYISRNELDLPIPISFNKKVELGQCPTFFHAGFQNSANQIKFSGIYNHKLLEQPFLSMTNDALRHIPYHFQIKNGNNIIHSANLSLIDSFYVFYGYDPADMKVTVPTGKYTVTLSDTHSVVGEIEASTIVDFELDLRKADKNPPRMRSFQLWTEDYFNPITAKISTKLYKYHKNYLKFILNDSTGIASVEMAITNFHTGEMMIIPIQANYPYYLADFPDLHPGYYTIKLKASDTYGNNFTSVMKPAFFFVDPNSIDEPENEIPQTFTLEQNFPNPFNASTTIRVKTNNNNLNNLKLVVYDLQGRMVRRLKKVNQENDFLEYCWNGKNEAGCHSSTGIYFGRLEGGGSDGLIKMLYIR